MVLIICHVDDGQGGLACCDSWGRKESDTTEGLKRTEENLKNPILNEKIPLLPPV